MHRYVIRFGGISCYCMAASHERKHNHCGETFPYVQCPSLKGCAIRADNGEEHREKVKILLRFAGQARAGLWISRDHGQNDISTVEALRVFLFINLFPSLQVDISQDLKGHSPAQQITEQVVTPFLRKNINPSTVHHPAPSASHPSHRQGSKREPSSCNPSVRPSGDDGRVQAHKKLQLSYPLLTVLGKTKQSYRIT